MAYKRKRTYAPRRAPVKRKRIARRRRSTRYGRKRTMAFVGNERPYNAFRTRNRRLPKRTFRNLLWRATTTQTKYHSYLNQAGTIATPASSLGTTSAMWALGVSNHSYEPFWTPNGGLVALSKGIPNVVDPTETTAQFDSDIIIRGGRFYCEVYNNTETADGADDLIRCKILLVKTPQTRDDSAFQSGMIPEFNAYNTVADFKTRIGYICMEKNFVIKDGESCKAEYRIPCQKINVGDYMNESFTYLLYIIVANGFGTTAQTCQYRYGHDISFCGDATT